MCDAGMVQFKDVFIGNYLCSYNVGRDRVQRARRKLSYTARLIIKILKNLLNLIVGKASILQKLFLFLHWQSDRRFAVSFTRERAMRGYGPVRIRYELRERGVVADVVIAREFVFQFQ